MQCSIFCEAKEVLSILGPNAFFLLPEGKEPSFSVQVSCIEGCEEEARAVSKEWWY